MNLKFAFPIGLTVFAFAGAAVAQDMKIQVPAETSPTGAAPSAGPGPAASAPTFTDEQLTEEFGWWIAKRVGISEFKFTEAERAGLIKGFSAGIGGTEAPYDLQKAGPLMDALMNKKQASATNDAKAKNTGETLELFKKLKENKNVVETPSGLRYEILKPGDGPNPAPTDTVKVNYTGKLIDGSVFDSSIQRGTPIEFPLNGVIAGWTEGIQKINKGGQIRLYIPAHLAYGDQAQPGIPAGSTLIFDVDLLDFHATAPAAPAGAPSAAPQPPAGGEPKPQG